MHLVKIDIFQLKARKKRLPLKEKQLAYEIFSFCLIVVNESKFFLLFTKAYTNI